MLIYVLTKICSFKVLWSLSLAIAIHRLNYTETEGIKPFAH